MESGTGPPTADGATPSPASAGDHHGALGDLTADLPARAADVVERIVSLVRDKAVRPAVIASRAVVFGLIAGTMAVVVGVLVPVAGIRLLDVYAFPGRVWASYFLVGAVLSTAGLLVWTRRTPSASQRSSR